MIRKQYFRVDTELHGLSFGFVFFNLDFVRHQFWLALSCLVDIMSTIRSMWSWYHTEEEILMLLPLGVLGFLRFYEKNIYWRSLRFVSNVWECLEG